MLSYDNKLNSVSYHNAQAADDATVEMTVKLRGLKYLAKKEVQWRHDSFKMADKIRAPGEMHWEKTGWKNFC